MATVTIQKAIEAKTVSTDAAADVASVIRTAMGQLCGKGRGGGALALPPANAARVIDVVVTSGSNAFPFYVSTGRVATWTTDQLVSAMQKRLREDCLDKHDKMNNWLVGEETDWNEGTMRLRNSSRLFNGTTGDRIRALTIKIRYNPAFDLMHAGNPIHVEEVITQALNYGDGVSVKVTKLKYTDHLNVQHRNFRDHAHG